MSQDNETACYGPNSTPSISPFDAPQSSCEAIDRATRLNAVGTFFPPLVGAPSLSSVCSQLVRLNHQVRDSSRSFTDALELDAGVLRGSNRQQLFAAVERQSVERQCHPLSKRSLPLPDVVEYYPKIILAFYGRCRAPSSNGFAPTQRSFIPQHLSLYYVCCVGLLCPSSSVLSGKGRSCRGGSFSFSTRATSTCRQTTRWRWQECSSRSVLLLLFLNGGHWRTSCRHRGYAGSHEIPASKHDTHLWDVR